MSTNTVDISNKIKTMLSTITSLNGVYEYVPAQNDTYPFVTIMFSEAVGEFGDTMRNIRHYIFHLDLFVERTKAGMGNERSETLFRTIVDQMLTLFDENTTLDGMVQMVTPISVEADIQDTDIGDTRVTRIIVDCMKVVNSVT